MILVLRRQSQAILIFSKFPRLGHVKTRLKPFLTDQQCLDLHVALLKDSIQKALQTTGDPILYLTENLDLPFSAGIQIRQQSGEDLGERMSNAFRESLNLYDQVLIIGIDSPTFPLSFFQEAFRRLENHDIVLGPSEDGGYYLIALSKPIPEIFQNIPWSTEKVFTMTLERLATRKVSLLERCFDVDQPADLQRLRNELKDVPYLSNTREWFRNNDQQKNSFR
jgi:uncharacterized protein